MNARMKEWLDLLAEREREEEMPGYIEILPALRAQIVAPDDLKEQFATRGRISQNERRWVVCEAA